MKGKMRQRKGAISVFLTLILISFIMATCVIASGAAGKAARSYGDGVMGIAGKSILSEFAKELKQDYGLLGVTMGKAEIEEKMRWYGENTFDVRQGTMDLLQLELLDLSADTSRYSLLNTDVLERQIGEYMKYRVPESILSGALGALDLLEGGGSWTEGTGSSEKNSPENQDGTDGAGRSEDRVLKHSGTISSLPSRIYGMGSSVLPEIENLPQLDTLFSGGKENLSINLYVLDRFRHALDDGEGRETFFTNEIEYILAGHLGDATNRRSVKAALIVLRAGINLAHIYSDPLKSQKVMEAAALLTPGPEAVLTQAALSAAWAAAEAANDMARLERGKKVPLYKTEEDWMIDLESVLNNLIQGEALEPASDKGMDYKSYLFLLLFFENRDTKLIRIMDLIQLNLRGRYDGNFSMAGCYSGFDVSVILRQEKGFLGPDGFRTGVYSFTRTFYPEE